MLDKRYSYLNYSDISLMLDKRYSYLNHSDISLMLDKRYSCRNKMASRAYKVRSMDIQTKFKWKTNAYSDLGEHITFPENVMNQVIYISKPNIVVAI